MHEKEIGKTLNTQQLNVFSDQEESSSCSDEEHRKKRDIFECSAYWQLENNRKKSENALLKNQIKKQNKLNQIGTNLVAGNYNSQKSTKMKVALNRLKPELKQQYPTTLENSVHLFNNPLQPVFENFVNEYMETTQNEINENIVLS